MSDLVSVIIPCFNGEKFVEVAIRSALDQDYDLIEVIVVDDGSTDSSGSVISSMQDERLRFLSKENGGVASARNFGVANAKGRYIAFLDQDDRWSANKISRQLSGFSDPAVGAVGCYLTYFGSKRGNIGRSGVDVEARVFEVASAELMPFAPSALIVRREVLDRVGGFDSDLVTYAGPVDDLDLMSRIAANWKIVTIPESLGGYRVHPDAGSFESFWKMELGAKFLRARIAERRMGRDLEWSTWYSRYEFSRAEVRLGRARFFYRRAGMEWAAGRTIRSFGWLGRSVMSWPSYVVRRLIQQSVHFRPPE